MLKIKILLSPSVILVSQVKLWSELYQRPGRLMVLHRISAVPGFVGASLPAWELQPPEFSFHHWSH